MWLGEYTEEVLNRELPEEQAFDGRFQTVRWHQGNNCKCTNPTGGVSHGNHHQAWIGQPAEVEEDVRAIF